MPARSKLSRYVTIARLATRDLWGYGVLYMGTWVTTTVILTVTVMALYVGAYRVAPQALPLSAAVWSIAIASFLRLTWRHITSGISDDVKSGNIALRMRYPVSYLGYTYADHMGRSLPTAAPFMALAAYAVGGLPVIPQPVVAVVVFLAMVVGSFVLSALLYTLMGLLSFWMEDALPALRIVEKMTVVLGGSVVPLALLPTGARHILEFIPFTATGFPAQFTSPDFLVHAPRLLTIEYGWVAVFTAGVMIVWRMAARRVEVNGG